MNFYNSQESLARSRVVNVLDYIENRTGTSDESANLQNAIDSADHIGGTIYIPSGVEILCLSDITLKTNCSLVGESLSTADAFTSDRESGLIMGSSASLGMEANSTLEKIRVRSQALNEATNFDNPSSFFVGTGINISSPDCTIKECSIFGFALGIGSTGATGRTTIQNLKMDNIACIILDDSQDVSRLNSIQCWPFCGGNSDTNLTRSGTAIKLTNNADWTKVSECFTWGYQRGFWINASRSNVQITGCGSDYPYLAVYSNGILVDGDSGNTIVQGFQSELVQEGIVVAVTPSADNLGCVKVSDSYFGRNTKGVRVNTGDSIISNCHFNGLTDSVIHLQGLTDGILLNDITSNVIASHNYYQNITETGSEALRQIGVPTGARVLNNNAFFNVTNQGDAT